jgi:flagellar basal-body rod modification protein FlgD
MSLSFSLTEVGSSSGASIVETNPFSYVGGAQFMQLLLAQLRYQNPLDPMQNEEMIMQLTQINSLQELQSINNALVELSRSSQMATASNMLGKTVTVSFGDGTTTEGVVTGISVIGNEVLLWLGEQMVPLSNVIKVVDTPKEGE